MGPLALDYQRKRVGVTWIGWLVLAAGIICSALVVYNFLLVREQKSDADTTLARLERKRVPVVRAELTGSDARRYSEEFKVAEAIAERLTLPWAELLQAVETQGAKEVAVLSLEPDAQKKQLRITAETKDKADMLTFVRKLNGDRRLDNVHLLEHQIQTQTPGRPVRFSVQATWTIGKS